MVNRSINMFTLIAMGTGVAYLYSLVATVFPYFFRLLSVKWAERLRYFEAAAQLPRWSCLGRCVELRARSRTGAAIRACSISRRKWPACCEVALA